ncbi:pyrimidine 5'-nucleotidase [Paenalcaligenes niemegkensis]|uniref:pyrimidine 5'-nucleotidase n=1 Tax=Paenalcaligenes niemegkensis TaxID=2895469 RepID=UPI001EE87D94|nr:pyrimidine 5'-nucleotidase [Paenalcaligenes niemegkensis]MCQ9615577.1 pyrimidine 5'-nucleotidase [Paenalcaligenes niemegkensis]
MRVLGRCHNEGLRLPKSSGRTPETVWLFDLDNTLHNASHGIFAAIDSRMALAVAEMLDVDAQIADTLRLKYWQRYGATMIGLHRHHNVSPHAFLHRSHDFDIAPLLSVETGLNQQLKRLPGRKIVLTNAPSDYASRVIRLAGMHRNFDGVWAIDHMRLQGHYRPKPSLGLMRQVLAALQVPARQVVLVEDTLRNLKAAKQLGMRTVHIFNAGTPYSAIHRGRNLYVDLRVDSIQELAQQVGQLSLVDN